MQLIQFVTVKRQKENWISHKQDVVLFVMFAGTFLVNNNCRIWVDSTTFMMYDAGTMKLISHMKRSELTRSRNCTECFKESEPRDGTQHSVLKLEWGLIIVRQFIAIIIRLRANDWGNSNAIGFSTLIRKGRFLFILTLFFKESWLVIKWMEQAAVTWCNIIK